MKAVVYEAFSAPPRLCTVPDPTPEAHGVVLRVMATGVCRSDWHGWVGHPEAVQELTGGGAHLSLDALGHPTTCCNSIACLRKRGRHVQVGLLLGDQATPALPMNLVIARELEILGSHGMQAHRYDVLMAMLRQGTLAPEKLIGREISLAESGAALMHMDRFEGTGVTVITRFD